MDTFTVSKGKTHLSSLNMVFTCAIMVWMITPYIFRRIPSAVLIVLFAGWLFTYIPYSRKFPNKEGLFAPILWFAYILIYKILGYSSASWGNYYVQFFFWLGIFIGYNCYNNYLESDKHLLVRFIWVVSIVNIIHNVLLLIRYPGASTFIYQPWGTQYLSMNVGDTSFSYFTVFFLCFNVAYLFVYRKHKVLATIGCIVSVVYIHQSARTTTYLMLGLIIICWVLVRLSNNTGKRSRKAVFFISILVSFLFVISIYPLLAELLAAMNSSSNVIKRLLEISNIVYGTNYATVDSGAGRIADTLISLRTWTSSLKNFLIGVGFSGKDARAASIQAYGIGQHSETFDCLARYGILGGILYFNAIIKSIKSCLRRIDNGDFYKWIYYSLIVYSFMNSFMNASLLCVYLFIVYPLCDHMNCEETGDEVYIPD